MADAFKLLCPIKSVLGLDLDVLCFLSSYLHSVIFILPSPISIWCNTLCANSFLWPRPCDTGTDGSVPDCLLSGCWVFSNYYSDAVGNTFSRLLSFVDFSHVLTKNQTKPNRSFPELPFFFCLFFPLLCLFPHPCSFTTVQRQSYKIYFSFPFWRPDILFLSFPSTLFCHLTSNCFLDTL